MYVYNIRLTAVMRFSQRFAIREKRCAQNVFRLSIPVAKRFAFQVIKRRHRPP